MASSLPVGSTQRPHFVLFPFMSKGHTIPLLHLASLLTNRNIMVTIFTTKANRPFISQFLEKFQNGSISIIELLFPSNVEGIPQGIESTDKLPSMSLFRPFTIATKLIQPHFEQALGNLADVTCIVSDGFLSWTLSSANKFRIPRLSFYGMNSYVGAVSREVALNQLLSGPESDDELITVPKFPWIKVSRNDFDDPFNKRDPTGPHMDFVMESVTASANSYGLITNSFYELEPMFLDYLNREAKPKAWCVGPLCLAESTTIADKNPKWMKWLDQKKDEGCSVLYVAFGSQAEITPQQMEAIAEGLEESEVNFLWVVRKSETSVLNELEEKVGDRGTIVTEWVNQRDILKHESVKGFLSHCGWNSVLESICSEVPILAWPMMAEQPLNARMVVEEIKIGLRVETCDGSVKGFVKSEGLKKMIKELMKGEKGKDVRKKVKEVGAAAKKAMAEGGSSWRTLNELIEELQAVRNHNTDDFPSSKDLIYSEINGEA
ncbi:glycosyltransferase UGT90A7 [Artemisia annua]|uniref:Glycosyltransferase n=1 Tax=Artemisia annua TaxID=35608 RepID=A0A2U1M9M1_ARTAN|nr:glycosyltransferase UGT90A7 [Artemisia annua]